MGVSDGTWTCKVKIGVNLQVDDHDDSSKASLIE